MVGDANAEKAQKSDLGGLQQKIDNLARVLQIRRQQKVATATQVNKKVKKIKELKAEKRFKTGLVKLQNEYVGALREAVG